MKSSQCHQIVAMELKTLQICHVTGVVICCVLAIVELALQATLQSELGSGTGSRIDWPRGGVPIGKLASRPENYQYGASRALLASAAVTVAMSIAGILYYASLWNQVGHL